MKIWLGVLVAILGACGDNELPDFKAYDQDPYFHWDGQPMVGAYGLDKESPEAIDLILHRIDALHDDVLVLYGHATAEGVSPETIGRIFARARNAGVDILTFADLARGGAKRPGVVVSFDDTEVDAWYGLRDTFARYDAHATFFATEYYEWTDDQRQKLHVLYDEGNDIEAHGVHHVNVCDYTASTGKGIEGYATDEVMPSIQILQADGFAPVAFAFPGGTMGNAIVDELAPLVPITRAITQLPE
jgi:hypothetical protein